MAPSTAAVRSAIEDGDLARNARFFADRMGWPVNIDVTHQRLIMRTGGILDALLLPRDLAEPVALELSSSLMTAPVHRDTSDCWWTFITEPRQHPHAEVTHELRADRVHAISPGEQLVIPPAQHHVVVATAPASSATAAVVGRRRHHPPGHQPKQITPDRPARSAATTAGPERAGQDPATAAPLRVPPTSTGAAVAPATSNKRAEIPPATIHP